MITDIKCITVNDISRALNDECSISGPAGAMITIDSVAPIDSASYNSLVFYNGKNVDLIENTKANVIICPHGTELLGLDNKTLIQVDNPRLSFIRVIAKYFNNQNLYLLKSSRGDSIYISRSSKILEGTLIYPNVTIYQNVTIGKNCIIHSGVTIGSDGFGFEKNEKGLWEKFPHVGGVTIGDNVEIQANSAISRGALSNTKIGNGTKIDNLVHVAHNVIIGNNCFIAAGTIFGGSATIGDNCWLGLNCTIRDWITLGNNVTVGMGSVVTKSFGDNVTLMGVPARVIKDNN